MWCRTPGNSVDRARRETAGRAPLPVPVERGGPAARDAFVSRYDWLTQRASRTTCCRLVLWLRGVSRTAPQSAVRLRCACLAPAPSGSKEGPDANDPYRRLLTAGDSGHAHVTCRYAGRMRLEIRDQCLANRLLSLRSRVSHGEYGQPRNVSAHRASRFGFDHNGVAARH